MALFKCAVKCTDDQVAQCWVLKKCWCSLVVLVSRLRVHSVNSDVAVYVLHSFDCHDRSIRQTEKDKHTLHWCLLSTALQQSSPALVVHLLSPVCWCCWWHWHQMSNRNGTNVMARCTRQRPVSGDTCDQTRQTLHSLCAFLCTQSRHTNKYGLCDALWTS